ncbi:(2Fe-2S)-binding protein [Acetobacter aceti]|uniref:Sarcosine oxidase subunit alpha n=1 Tax=Acetobacter aceti TaxID=435 RepID=A0A6S6PM32_ACEAC|nr:(2Fe-2S)-binding protein [Acetobacter aceti]BCI65822.1 sarcosine oxidase subunit alpha [Acetobacter aceti]
MVINFLRSRLAPSTDIRVIVEGRDVPALAGESVAAILLRTFEGATGSDSISRPRAPYCMMGICFECVAIVDGMASVRTCLIPAKDGMRITRQNGPSPLQEVPRPKQTGSDE